VEERDKKSMSKSIMIAESDKSLAQAEPGQWNRQTGGGMEDGQWRMRRNGVDRQEGPLGGGDIWQTPE
jgi:hypothetical protein